MNCKYFSEQDITFCSAKYFFVLPIQKRMKPPLPNQAQRLAYLRRQSGMTLREVGDKIGLSHSRIDAYESEPTIRIKMDKLRLLADLYETTIEYIETGVERKMHLISEVQEVSPIIEKQLANDTEEYETLPFVPFSAYGTFAESCHDQYYGDYATYKVLRRPGIDYRGAVVVEVRGNSMAPRYPDQSCHVVRPVSNGDWQYAMGVHCISLRNPMFVIKRIISNTNGTIRLRSDANGEEIEIELGDINCMWKVGEKVYEPAED
jgi:transcriptional regulator with XRE-family HTH domain